jgi:hypothetical protein
MRFFQLGIATILLHSLPLFADDQNPEIDFLLSAIGSSECVFVRNGKRHEPKKAEQHLRMKYERGRRYATSAEAFIERLASKSLMTRKLYMIECPGAEPVPSGVWLMQRLEVLRNDPTTGNLRTRPAAYGQEPSVSIETE